MSNAPTILLFGTPGAGKSSLLGALGQAAMQPGAFKGKLIDPSGRLLQLQKSVLQGVPTPTTQPMAYDLQIQPEPGAPAMATQATVLDISGKSAVEMLQAKSPFVPSQPLQKPVLNADAILLLVDASEPTKELLAEFQQFARWLLEFRKARGQRAEVGALPVFLVLTKCDLLAKPNDTFPAWMERIEQAKQRITQAFRDAVALRGPGFGTISLRLAATAITRPELADRPKAAQEPFGVAELFRQCFVAAADYTHRRDVSQYRLHNVIIALIGSIALLLAVVMFLMEFQPDRSRTVLAEQAEQLLPNDGTSAATRLGGTLKRLEEKQQQLVKIQNNPEFESLPRDLQQSIVRYQGELSAYLKASQDFQTLAKLPRMAKDEAELKAQQDQLAKFKIPDDWQDTSLGRRLARHVKEYQALYEEAGKEIRWSQEQIATNYHLLDQSDAFWKKVRDTQPYTKQELLNWHKLRAQFDQQIQQKPYADRFQFIPDMTGFKFESLGMLQKVEEKRREWHRTQEALAERAAFIDKKLTAKT